MTELQQAIAQVAQATQKRDAAWEAYQAARHFYEQADDELSAATSRLNEIIKTTVKAVIDEERADA